MMPGVGAPPHPAGRHGVAWIWQAVSPQFTDGPRSVDVSPGGHDLPAGRLGRGRPRVLLPEAHDAARAGLALRAGVAPGVTALPSSFFDLSLHRRHLEKTRPDNPYSPPVSLLYSLAEALRFLDGFGHEAWFSERKRLASGFEAACEAMGLPLFVDDQALRSPVVTAVAVPQGAGKALRSAMETLGVTVAGGQSREPDLLRVGHYAPGGWPELCLLTGSVYGAGRRCGLPLMDGFLDAAWRCWSKEGAKEQ